MSSLILLTEAGVPETLSPNLKVKYGKFTGCVYFADGDDRPGGWVPQLVSSHVKEPIVVVVSVR